MEKKRMDEKMMKKAGDGFSLKEYLYRVRWTVMCIAAVTFITHGSILFSQRFGIDTDAIMNGDHNFTLLGRQGLVWLAKFLDLDWFNLYLAQILVLVFMTLFPVVIGYLLYRMSGQSGCLNLSLLVLGLSVVVSPFWTAQIYFLNQSPQVLLACVLIPVAILLAETARPDIAHKWYCLVLSVALMQVIFACYQTLIMVYVTAVAAAFLLSFLKEEYAVKKALRWIGFHAGAFFIGFLLYWVISRLFFMQGYGYLEYQLAWGKSDAPDVILNCLRGIKRSLTNAPPYYTGMYGIFSLLLAVISLYRTILTKKRKYLLFLAAEAFLMFTPYVFVFAYGSEILPRMQLIMPLSQGCILYLTVLLLGSMKGSDAKAPRMLKRAAVLILALCLYKDTLSHLNYCTRFYYTDEWVYQYSRHMAEEIYSEIADIKKENSLDSSYHRILFLGTPHIPYNNTCMGADVIGASAFCWDVNTIYRDRIFRLFRNLGYPLDGYFSGTDTTVFNAYFEDYFGTAVDEMPLYPVTGYVSYLKNDEIGLDYIVIKLEDNWRNLWAEEN